MATLTVPQKTARLAANPVMVSKLNRCDHFFIGDEFIIASATELGKLYRVSARGCTCKAGEHGIKCWHVDAYRYLQAQAQPVAGPRTVDEVDEAEDRAVVAPPAKRKMSDEEYQRIVASCDELTSVPVRRERVKERF